jgi:hypothetical protein
MLLSAVKARFAQTSTKKQKRKTKERKPLYRDKGVLQNLKNFGVTFLKNLAIA